MVAAVDVDAGSCYYSALRIRQPMAKQCLPVALESPCSCAVISASDVGNGPAPLFDEVFGCETTRGLVIDSHEVSWEPGELTVDEHKRLFHAIHAFE
jgi:hypothetical protein